MNEPTAPRSQTARLVALVLAALLLGGGLLGVYLLRRGEIQPGRGIGAEKAGLPEPGSDVYREMVSAFQEGVATLDADALDCAQAALERATKLVPEEPAAWADLGLLKLRRGDYPAAGLDLERARSLAPGSGEVERLLGLLKSNQGEYAEAIAHLRRAVERNPDDLRSRYALVKEVERQADPDSDAEALRLVSALSNTLPDNVVVLLERARLAVKQGDVESLGEAVSRLGKLAPSWPDRARGIFGELEQADPRTAATRVVFLRNVLLPTLPFRQALAVVETPVGTVGESVKGFLRLKPPPLTAAAPDEGLTFAIEPIEAAAPAGAVAVAPAVGDDPPTVFAMDAEAVHKLVGPAAPLPFPGRADVPPSPHGVLAIDWNSDYRMDLVLAGAGGLKILKQNEDGAFVDATAGARLDAAVVGADYFGVWAADVEMDGDLDLILGARTGKTIVLQNNGDGTFAPIDRFGETTDLRDFVWADLDGDGAPDATLLDARGATRFESNERAGEFKTRPTPEGLGAVAALAVSDLDGDGKIDLVAMRGDGTVVRVADRDEGKAWDVVDAVAAPGAGGVGEGARLFVADLDNNGAPDLIGSGASGVWIQLADGQGGFRKLDAPKELRVFATADLNADGRLDLVGLAASGKPARALGRGAKDYHWMVVRPRGAKTFGDGRINSFGLGGEVQVRAGLLAQTQVIDGPALHFGLGENDGFDIARIVWPNGTAQTECHGGVNLTLTAEQRLKGSCPFLYAFDGTAVRFVADFIWRSPLGLRINAQDTAGVAQTEDWVKIRGDQLAPRDGSYDVRITAELWETHYWDHVALLAVDHPAETEVFVDERFARRPPRLEVLATAVISTASVGASTRG